MEVGLPPSVVTTRVVGAATPTVRRAIGDLDARIYPLRAMRFTLPDYDVYDGFPSTTPLAKCTVRVATSASGEMIVDVPPDQLSLGATKRWLATTNYTTTKWLPMSPVTNESYYWTTTSAYAPEQVVRTWSERVAGTYRTMSRTGLSFPVSGLSHLWASFPVDEIREFMVMMVVDPYDTSGQYAILDTGGPTPLAAALPADESLSAFDEPTDNRSYLHAVSRSGTTALSLGMSGGSSLTTTGADVSSQWPSVVAVVGRTTALELYTWGHSGARPARNSTTNPIKSLPRAATPYSTSFLLGRANGTIDQCAQMTLFEVAFWERAPGDLEVTDIMARLRTAYQTVAYS